MSGQAWGMGSQVAAILAAAVLLPTTRLRTRMAHDLRVNGPDLHGAVH